MVKKKKKALALPRILSCDVIRVHFAYMLFTSFFKYSFFIVVRAHHEIYPLKF